MITNIKQLATSKPKHDALQILTAGVKIVQPHVFFPKQVSYKNQTLNIGKKSFDISKGKLYVIGGGKASGTMAAELEKIIPAKDIYWGQVNAAVESNTKKINIISVDKPLANNICLNSTREMLKQTVHLKPNDQIVCLLSGGGSNLLTLPKPGITIKHLNKMNKILFNAGVPMPDIQCIRKHISQIKGGQLSASIHPNTLITLVLSDVVNPIDVTAAGPAVPDQTTYQQADETIKKYQLETKLPQKVIQYIKQGLMGESKETPDTNDTVFENTHEFILANIQKSFEEMSTVSAGLGYNVQVIPDPMLGDAGLATLRLFSRIKQSTQLNKRPTAIIYSSETSSSVTGSGLGGRNQEHIAMLLPLIRDMKSMVVAGIDTDGADCINGVGGAICDQDSYNLATAKNLNIDTYLTNNDTFHLHEELGSLIKMDRTGTNVGDIRICLIN
jgi:glycerate 2-kinase